MNRHPIKNFFITFPKSGEVSKQDFYEFLAKQRIIDGILIAQEEHEDGTPHLHAVVKYSQGITKTALLLRCKQQYPNEYKRIDLKGVKNMRASVNYLRTPEKDKIVDTNPLEIGDLFPKPDWINEWTEEDQEMYENEINEREERRHRWQFALTQNFMDEKERLFQLGPNVQ